MTAPRPFWSSGVDLTPQHLQLADRFAEEQLAARLALSAPLAWGVNDVALDVRALSRGDIGVERLSAVLADGTLLELGPSSGIQLAARNLATQVGAGSSVDVLVGVPKLRNGPNAAAAGAPTYSRYVERTARVVDFNSGDDPVELLVGDLRPMLLLSTERLDDFDAIAIARVQRGADGTFSLDVTFAPPALELSAAPALTEPLGALASALSAHLARIGADYGRRGRELDGPQAFLAIQLAALRGLSVRLGDVLSRRGAHPHEAFVVLAELTFALSVFDRSGAEQLPELPPYDHRQLSSCFAPLFRRAKTILEGLGTRRYVQVPLQKAEGPRFYAELKEPTIFRNVFFLAASGGNEAALREQLPKLMKIAAWEEIVALVSSNSPGARFSLEYRPPQALPLRPGAVYFRIDPNGREWQSIMARGNLCVLQPFETNQVTLELFAVDPTEAGTR